MKKSFTCAIALAIVAVPALASAQDDAAKSPTGGTPETWLLMGSVSGASAASDPHDEAHDIGATGGLGLYRSVIPQLSLGARVDAGALPIEETDGDNTFDENTMGLGSLNAAARVRPFARMRDAERATGFYLEAAGGPGLLENDVRPFLTPGAGYVIPVGDVGIGPTARYIHVFEPDNGTATDNDVQIGTVGIELVLFDRRTRRYETPELERPVPAPVERFEPAARVEPQPIDDDADDDGIRDANDTCVSVPETVNGVDDHDGCPDSGEISMVGNRVVLDEKTFFDYDEAGLRPEGKQKLDHLVTMYKSGDSNWTKLRVEGHADVRGPMPYNADLSRRRAEAVRDYLVSQGIPSQIIDIEAYGETRPSVPNAETEREHQENRRVEFVIER